jgi:hypothetical protein
MATAWECDLVVTFGCAKLKGCSGFYEHQRDTE